MAEFNPQISETGVPNFTGVSQGTGRDDSFATLFGGLTQAAGDAVTIRDEQIQSNIRKDADAAFQKTNTEFGFDPPSTPTSMASDLERMKTLQAAVEQGKISQVNYYGRLATLSKQLRTKYPGYEEIVDATIQSVTGTRPANAFRDALLSEMDNIAQSASDAVKFQRQWTKENEGILSAIYGDDYFVNPDKYDFAQAQAKVAAFKGKSELISSESKELELMAKRGEFNDKRATKAIDQDFSFIVESTLNKSLGLNSPSAMAQINQFIARGGGSGEELNQFVSSISALESNLRAELTTRGRQHYVSSGVMSQDAVNKAIDAALYPVIEAKKAVLGGDFKLAAKFATVNKAITDHQLNTMLNADPTFRAGMGLNELNQNLGEAFFGERQTELETLALEVAGQTMAGRPDVIRNVVEAGDSKVSRSVMEQSFRVMLDPKATNEAFSNVVDQFFGPGAIDFMSPKVVAAEDLERIYLQFLRPEVTKAVFSKGSEEDKQKYTQWALEKAQAIPAFRAAMGDVGTLVKLDSARIKVNPETMRVSLVIGEGAGQTPYPYGRVINAFNKVVTVLKPILDESGLDPETAVLGLVRQFNVQVGGDSSLWKGVEESLLRASQSDAEGDPSGNAEGEIDSTFLLPEVDLEGTSILDFVDKTTGEYGKGPGLAALVSSGRRGQAPDIRNLRPELASDVQSLQAAWGKPLPIVSGYRDAARNKKAGGAKHSQHLDGNAVDIDASNLSQEERIQLIKLARERGFGGVGVYSNSIHLDKGGKRAWGPTHKSDSLPAWAKEALSG